MGETDLSAIRQLFQEKTCTYQIRQGRDLLCSVASASDPTRREQTGLQTVAPTSRALCRTCKLPDTDYICSHLMHPEVVRRDEGTLQISVRFVRLFVISEGLKYESLRTVVLAGTPAGNGSSSKSLPVQSSLCRHWPCLKRLTI